MPLFTWGYAGARPAELERLIRELRIDRLVDCRSNPHTRVPGFGRRQLEDRFPAHYYFGGDELGGRGRGVTRAGLDLLGRWLREGLRIVAMCMEREPGDCHRHYDIAMPLVRRGHDVWHVYRDEGIVASELQRSMDDDDAYAFVPLADLIKRRT